MIKVELTDVEAGLLKDVQKWYELLAMLNKNKVFGLKSAALTIHFDSQGKIAKIEKLEYLRP